MATKKPTGEKIRAQLRTLRGQAQTARLHSMWHRQQHELMQDLIARNEADQRDLQAQLPNYKPRKEKPAS